jgi:hypothetical protein
MRRNRRLAVIAGLTATAIAAATAAVVLTAPSPWPTCRAALRDDTSGYMSDPDALIDGTNRYLVWADGDYEICGGFKSAKLNEIMLTLTSGTGQPLAIIGVDVLGNCVPGQPRREGSRQEKPAGANRHRTPRAIFAGVLAT